MDIDRVVRIIELLDLYDALLTPKQRAMMQYYYYDNYTLGEIAELESISRNAVHDQITRTVIKLEDYEGKLGLLDKSKKRQALLEALENTTEDAEIRTLLASLKKVD